MSSASLDEDEETPLVEKQDSGIRSHWLKWVVIIIAVAWFGIGVWVGHVLEEWHLVTAVYVMVQIITTIGYGDITFKTESMKLYTAIYVLVGLMIVAGLVTNIVNFLLDRQEQVIRDSVKKFHGNVQKSGVG